MRPFGLNAMNCGGPTLIGMVAVTWFAVVSTTVTTPASRLATYSWCPFGAAPTKLGVCPTLIAWPTEGTGTAVGVAKA